MKKSQTIYSLIKIPLDFLSVVYAFNLAHKLRINLPFGKDIDLSQIPPDQQIFKFSLYAAAAFSLCFIFNKIYALKNTDSIAKELRKTTTTWAIWIMLILSSFFFTRTVPYARLAFFYAWGIALILVYTHRIIIHQIKTSFLKSGVGQTKVLIIGNNKTSKLLTQKLQTKAVYKVIPALETKSLNQLEYLIKKHQVDQIIQTKSANHLKNTELLEFCEANHVTYRFVPDLLEVKAINVETETVAGIPIINMKPTPLEGWGKILKRTLDIIGAIFGLIILSPIMLITAIAIKLDSKGPVIFSKLDDGKPVKRIGQKGQSFKFYKFRSMKQNSHMMRYNELAKQDTRKDGPLVKIKNDPRITRVGKFIRRYDIDEFPQLWNVLIGDMSLVGPRPHLPEEVSKYQNHHRFVLTIKPGMTGLPQISGRSDLSFEEEVKLDRYYIENWSILLDIKIILKTIGVIFRKNDY